MAKNKTARYQAKHLQRGRRSAGRCAAPLSREDRSALRLMICGGIFVLLVAVKLLFPHAVGNMARSARQMIGQDADFKEAFAAMGRAISGEEDVSDSLRDAYTAVFNPLEEIAGEEYVSSPYTAAQTDKERESLEMEFTGGPAAEEENFTQEQPVEKGGGEADAVKSDPKPEEEPSGDDTVTESMSYVYSMPALPENASLEQRSLGFSYTSPVSGTLSSTFGWRDHPVDGENKFHYGLDLAADTGAEICAFADGEVFATGESSTLGNYIMLRHPGGYITLYAHCSKVTVSSGAVAKGDKIAEVGETGTATGPHLHFELHDGGLYLNPIYYVEVG